MSSRLLAAILILSLGLPLTLTFSILWYFGVLDLVGPILMPILIPIVTFVVIAIITVPLLCQTVTRQTFGDVPDRQVWDGTRPDRSGQGTVRDVSGTFYLIPVYCPHCGYEVTLGTAEWVGSQVLQCQNCLSDIEIRVVEGHRG
ncbi:MAG: hypothetical protein JSW61_04005 [Candidatus Thorarchaeota archaeon]|nr:MAG: hypothetical protein JSW61_04005 [Candidatus Thorarchaeota archaeon]